jgi:hypothetical protein
MPRERDVWPPRIKAIEREYSAVRLGTVRLLSQAQVDPTILSGGFRFRDIGHAAERLEGTYLIRLYAEFETGLRKYWETIRSTHPRMEDLIESIASRQKIPFDLTLVVHTVRNFRNSLVHVREGVTETVTIGNAQKYLCRYFGRLPQDWE